MLGFFARFATNTGAANGVRDNWYRVRDGGVPGGGDGGTGGASVGDISAVSGEGVGVVSGVGVEGRGGKELVVAVSGEVG